LVFLYKDIKILKETKLKKTIISLPDELWKKVKIQAIEEETTLSRLVVKALEMYFSQKKSDKS